MIIQALIEELKKHPPETELELPWIAYCIFVPSILLTPRTNHVAI